MTTATRIESGGEPQRYARSNPPDARPTWAEVDLVTGGIENYATGPSGDRTVTASSARCLRRCSSGDSGS